MRDAAVCCAVAIPYMDLWSKYKYKLLPPGLSLGAKRA